VTVIAEHNHPPMVTCPDGCPVGSGMTIVATGEPTAPDTPVDSAVDNPAPDNESAQVSEGAPEDTPVDTPVDKPPAKKAAARKRTAKKAAEAPPADATPPSAAEAVEQIAKKAPAKKARKSGQSAAQEEGAKQADSIDDAPADAAVDVESDIDWFRSPGFQRMRTAWEGEDKRQMDRVQGTIDEVVFETFQDAYAVMSDLYDLVREPATDEHGTVLTDPAGFTIWAKNPLTGSYIEDWTVLTIRQREDFLFRITTSLFEWEQRSANLWTRAMFSKGMFVEKFSIEYDAPISGTIDDRNARGNKEAAEDRYFALMNSAISRKAEALVRSMTNLMLRLKDTLGQ
jgi:hypothetical protein